MQQESDLKDDKTQTVIGRLEDFDQASGNFAERAIFNHRPLVILLCPVSYTHLTLPTICSV